jgi:hypothetical protein
MDVKHPNALAYGNTSFSDCGQQYPVTDLQRIKRPAVIFVRGVLKSLEKSISSTGYATV